MSHNASKPSPVTTSNDLIRELKKRANPNAVSGMGRFGIRTTSAFGVSVPELRKIARRTGKNHEIAAALWKSGVHEARILAGMIDDPSQVNERQMDAWVSDFDSWDVVDGTCGNLFDRTPFAVKKAHEWSARAEQFVKRAGFVMIAELAVHDKQASDKIFLDFLPIILREACDERNFVKKAVNWSLRQIGKRNLTLNEAAIRTSKQMQKQGSRSASWIAADALRELESIPVRRKLSTSR